MLRVSMLMSLLPGTTGHGFMNFPVAIQPGAADINLQDKWGGPDSANHYRDAASWYTPFTWIDNIEGQSPASFPGKTQIHGSCGIHHAGNSDTECGSLDHMHDRWGLMTTAGYNNSEHQEPSYGEERYCDARRYLPNATVHNIQWIAGNEEHVAWSMSTNHQGAIGYRLCPFETVVANNDVGKDGATEQCFQAGHLEFASSKTCIRCPGGSSSTDVCYDAVDVAGENGNVYRTWENFVQHTCPDGVSKHDYCTAPTTKTPCTNPATKTPLHGAAWSLLDKVKVPAGLTGKFVLGFRWDCGSTPQVWQNCAVVEIVAGSPASA